MIDKQEIYDLVLKNVTEIKKKLEKDSLFNGIQYKEVYQQTVSDLKLNQRSKDELIEYIVKQELISGAVMMQCVLDMLEIVNKKS